MLRTMKITITNTNIIAPLILALLMGCSGKVGKSTAKFDVRLAGLTSLNNFGNGGAMLYGQSVRGDRFGKRLDNIAADSISLDLPNGTWDFSVLLWDGDHDNNTTGAQVPLTGKVRCGRSLGNSLTGGDVTISLNASNGDCALPFFSPETNFSTEVFFPEIEIKTCRPDLASVSGETAPECQNEGQGFITSARVLLIPYKDILEQPIEDGLNDAIIGPCLSLSNTLGNPSLNIKELFDSNPATYNLPGGTANSPFKMVLRSYFGTGDCDDSEIRGFEDIFFPGGFNEPHPFKRVITHTPTTDAIKTLLIRTPEQLICNGLRGDLNSDFSTGGRAGSYFNGICNADQFDFLSSGYVANYQSANFILLRDINYFDGLVLDPNTDLNIPEFPMVGTPFTTSATNDPNPFTGVFEGNNKRIKGMRIDKENEVGTVGDLGFVRSLGSGGIIRNLTFVLPEIWADSYDDHIRIGIVAGSSNSGTISNISVVNGAVEGRSDVGGIVGRMSAGAITDVEFDDGDVEAFFGAGGIAGYLTGGGTITRASFVGGVYADGPDGQCDNPAYYDFTNCTGNGGVWADAKDFGGIVGFIQTSGTINESTSKGVILGGYNIGGLVGRAEATNITDSYSLAAVMATSTDNGGTGANSNTGGLAGAISGGGTWTRVFHTLGTVLGPGLNIGAKQGLGTIGTEVNVLGTNDNSTTYATIRDATAGAMSGIFNTGNWAMDDTGFDFPRFSWEAPRFCSGKFSGTFAGGDGSPDNPYLICSAAQLANIGPTINFDRHYKLARPIDASALSQTNKSIIFNSGTISLPFEGTFDGDGMIINNITVANSGETFLNPIGLFGKVGVNGIVKNFVGIVKVDLNNSLQTYTAGGIVGFNEGTIDRVSVFGQVKSIATDNNPLGGIVGENRGVVIGSGSSAVVRGNNKVGGLVGSNKGGLITYSTFQGIVTPIATGSVATRVGGIAGENIPLGGDSYYDPIFDEVISYNGTIKECSIYGSLDTRFGTAGQEGIFDTAGLITGYNQSEIYDIVSYGRIKLNLNGGQPTYRGTFDASAGEPGTSNIGDLWVVNTAGGFVSRGGVTATWNIGDVLLFHTGGVGIRVPSGGLNTTLLTVGTTTVAPFVRFGVGVGVNQSPGNISNVSINQNTEYNGAQYFSPLFGGFVGDPSTGSITGVLTEGNFNFPGSNSVHIDDVNSNYMVHRGTQSRLIEFLDTAQEIGSSTIQADTAGIFTGENLTSTFGFALGSYGIVSSSLPDGSNVIYTGQVLETGVSLDLFVQGMEFNDTNYPGFFATELGWNVGDSGTPGAIWEIRNSGEEASLIRVHDYEELPETQDFIDLINSI